MGDHSPMAYLRLERPAVPDGTWTLRYASAGHPHALLRTPEGDVELLDAADGLLLGVAPELPRHTATRALRPGSVLLLYTDGLVERRGEDIDESEQALLRWLGDQPTSQTAGQLAAAIIRRAGSHRDDDTAVLVLRLPQ